MATDHVCMAISQQLGSAISYGHNCKLWKQYWEQNKYNRNGYVHASLFHDTHNTATTENEMNRETSIMYTVEPLNADTFGTNEKCPD